jgi:hypothetical protein
MEGLRAIIESARSYGFAEVLTKGQDPVSTVHGTLLLRNLSGQVDEE